MTRNVYMADSVLHWDLAQSAIGLFSAGGQICCAAMDIGADGAIGLMCTLGSDATCGDVDYGVVDCGWFATTLGDKTLGGC